MAAAAVPLAIVAGAAILGSGILSGKAQEDEAKFKASQLDFQAKLAELNAERRIEQGEHLVRKIQRQKRQTIGKQRTAFAAQGIAVDADTQADLQADVELFAALDEMQARENAAFEARGIQMEAANLRAEAVFTAVSGARARRATVISAGGRAVGTIGSALGRSGGGFGNTSEKGDTAKG